MTQVACNRTNPHLVVPHLIVRTPLPSGSAPATMTHIAELQNSIAAWSTSISTLEVWREEVVDPELASLGERITDVEVGLAPVGSIMMWPKATPPSRWLLCNGATLTSSLYPDLAALIGTGGATFTLPDLRNRFVRGYNSVGDLLDTFAASTAAPVSAVAVPTTGGTTLSHKHTITGTDLGTAGAHTPAVTVNSANASHHHGEPTTGGGLTSVIANHDHSIAAVGTHQHCLGVGGTPLMAFTNASLAAALVPLPYVGNEAIYDSLNATNQTFFVSFDPVVHGFGKWYADWKSEAAGGQSSTTTGDAGTHAHTIPTNTAPHTHTATGTAVAAHTHTGETDNATIAAHQHSVSKTTGWDSETKPMGMLLNFIIRY